MLAPICDSKCAKIFRPKVGQKSREIFSQIRLDCLSGWPSEGVGAVFRTTNGLSFSVRTKAIRHRRNSCVQSSQLLLLGELLEGQVTEEEVTVA